jgi:aminopeptidase N
VVLILLLSIAVSLPGCSGDSTSGRTASTAPVTSQGAETIKPATTSSSAASTTATPPVTGSATSGTTMPATLGSPGSGDPYFPSNGNGGYDVQHYDIALDIDPASGRISGNEIVTASATQGLSGFHLDMLGLDLSTVEVDGRPVSYERSGQELRITPPVALEKDDSFTVTLAYSGVPISLSQAPFALGWQRVDDTIFTLDEPQGAATWFAVNDTPADKATYTFRLTVPQAYTATANGVLVATETTGAGRTFVWRMEQPMASYLAALGVDRFTLERSTSAGGIPIRNYFAEEILDEAQDAFARTGEVIDFFVGLIGPYPFAAYGVVVPDAETGAAMENQTLSLFGRDVVTESMAEPGRRMFFLTHELAHQWFGNSVTIERWDDIWLNEGFATYAYWLWIEHDSGPDALRAQVESTYQGLSRSSEPPPGKPGAASMFGASVYGRGALTLHALRLTVGDESFFRILRTWADRHKYGNVETADLIALAKELAPQVPPAQLDALFDAWLYQTALPPLPEPATLA